MCMALGRMFQSKGSSRAAFIAIHEVVHSSIWAFRFKLRVKLLKRTLWRLAIRKLHYLTGERVHQWNNQWGSWHCAWQYPLQIIWIHIVKCQIQGALRVSVCQISFVYNNFFCYGMFLSLFLNAQICITILFMVRLQKAPRYFCTNHSVFCWVAISSKYALGLADQ